MLNIITIDDERSALNILNRAVQSAVPDAHLESYTDVGTLLQELREKSYYPDVAFLDIEMPGIDGLELAQMLKMLYPKVNIIFVTGFSQYALNAYSLRPSGYLTKPVTKEDIFNELHNLRNPPARTTAEKSIRIRCFGSFDVYVNGEPIRFLRSKSKEMLAYLVDCRGGCCTAAKIAATLWEDGIYDRSRQKQFSVIRADLIKLLKQAGAEQILSAKHDLMAVMPDYFDCDYYMMLAGDSVAINEFNGEYMVDYSWAEFTTSAIADRFSNM